MKPSPQDLHRRVADALERIQVVTAAAGRRAADGAQLSPLQMGLLRRAVRQPGQRVGDLAKALEVTPGTLSVALSSLEAKGLVAKETDPSEHRAALVVPTRRGRNTATRLAAWPDAVLAPLVEDLGEQQAGEVLVSLLSLLRAAELRGLIDGTRMCLHCRYFRPFEGQAESGRPHYCDLLDTPLAAASLQVDCPDFERADADLIAQRPSILGSA